MRALVWRTVLLVATAHEVLGVRRTGLFRAPGPRWCSRRLLLALKIAACSAPGMLWRPTIPNLKTFSQPLSGNQSTTRRSVKQHFSHGLSPYGSESTLLKSWKIACKSNRLDCHAHATARAPTCALLRRLNINPKTCRALIRVLDIFFHC